MASTAVGLGGRLQAAEAALVAERERSERLRDLILAWADTQASSDIRPFSDLLVEARCIREDRAALAPVQPGQAADDSIMAAKAHGAAKANARWEALVPARPEEPPPTTTYGLCTCGKCPRCLYYADGIATEVK